MCWGKLHNPSVAVILQFCDYGRLACLRPELRIVAEVGGAVGVGTVDNLSIVVGAQSMSGVLKARFCTTN